MPLTWMASERLPTDGRGEVQSPVAGKDELAAVWTLMPTIAQSLCRRQPRCSTPGNLNDFLSGNRTLCFEIALGIAILATSDKPNIPI